DHWAAANLPDDSRIVFDDLAYLAPNRFPRKRMRGGVMTYGDLQNYRPDYFFLCASLFDAPWYQDLRRPQHLSMLDLDPFSVRLYQDLLDRRPFPFCVGPTGVSGIELVAAFTPTFKSLDDWESDWTGANEVGPHSFSNSFLREQEWQVRSVLKLLGVDRSG